MDSFKKLIQKAKQDGLKPTNDGTKTLKKAINSSKWRLILSTLTVLLLIVPTCYMLTYLYYVFGTKTTTFMDMTSKTLYITEPNTSLEEHEFDMDFYIFYMNLSIKQYKQIDDDFYPSKTYDLQVILNDRVKKEENSKLKKKNHKNPTQTNQCLAHP